MKIKTAWLFFEQSGTFKKEFQKLGVPAFDVDIINNFGETDFCIDLFKEIKAEANGGKTIFSKTRKRRFDFRFLSLYTLFSPCALKCAGRRRADEKLERKRKA